MKGKLCCHLPVNHIAKSYRRSPVDVALLSSWKKKMLHGLSGLNMKTTEIRDIISL